MVDNVGGAPSTSPTPSSSGAPSGGTSPAASSPASDGAGTHSSGPSATPSDGGFAAKFAGMFMDSVDGDADGPASPPTPGTPVNPALQPGAAAPTGDPAALAPGALPQPPQPQVPPVAGAQPAPPAQGQQPPTNAQPGQPAFDYTRDTVAMLNSMAGEAQQALAINEYGMTEADKQAILADPAQAAITMLPQALARVHYNVAKLLHTTIAQIVPDLVRQGVERHRRAQEVTSQFSSMFPELREEHLPVVKNAARMIRQTFPQLSQRESMQKAGELALQTLGIARQARPQPQAGAPAAPAPRVVAQAVPFSPAGGGLGGAPISQADPNKFAGMFTNYDEEE